MNKRVKSWWILCYLLGNFSTYGLTFLLSVTLWSESVGAIPKGTGMEIAQPNRAAAEQALQALAEGKRLYQQGTEDSLRKAIEKLQEAVNLWQQVKDKRGEAYSFMFLALVYDNLGEKHQALNSYNQALPLFQAVGDGGSGGKVSTLKSIGRLYNDLGDNQRAFDHYKQVLPLERAVGDTAGEATTLNLIGKAYSNLGEKKEALEFFYQALPLSQAVGDKSGEARTLNNIGTVYSNLGDNQRALDYYNQALPLLRALGDKGGEGLTLNNIGLVYSDLGDNQRALEYYNKQALPLLRAVGDKSGEANTLNNIGTVYDESGEKLQALSFYKQALALYHAVGDRRNEATTLNNIGAFHSAVGEKQKALDDYNQVLLVRRAIGDKGGEAITLNNIGKVYSDLGNKQKALDYSNQALPLIRAVGDKGGEALTLYNIANFERDRGNLQVALSQIEEVVKIVEDLRSKVATQELRTSYFATVQSYYKFYIDLLMQLHKQNPSHEYNALALKVAEKSRARGLLELLTEARANIRKGANPEILAQEKRLLGLIDAKEKLRFEIVNSNKINDPISKAAAEKLTKEVSEYLDEYKQLQEKIKKSNPKYASLKYPQPLTLPQIQQQLDKDTLLLEYSLGKKRSYLWAVSSNSLDTYELPKQQEIEKAAINLYCLISKSSSKPPSTTGKENACANIKTRRTDLAAQELSQLILAPLKDKLGQKRLVIVADGALQYIPFAVLAQPGGVDKGRKTVQEKGSGNGGRGGINVEGDTISSPLDSHYQPLLVNHEIVNLPSASTIAIQRQELTYRKKAPKTLAVLADPVFNATDERVTGRPGNTQLARGLELERSNLARSANLLNRSIWGRLTYTRTEAESLLKLVPESNRLQVFDFDANYTWATSNALNQFRILHFATHGFVNDENPELSGIVFSLVDQQGKDIQGYLRLNELFNLDYPADLIVLSACETGLGKNIQGEGLVGLTRGLMYAGAERLVVSLWQVNDEGTAVLMQEFYNEMLQNGKSPNIALRAAQLKMWQQEKWRDPNYWAAFTLQGEWR